MGNGWIYDQLRSGFSRYSSRWEKWLCSHFEKNGVYNGQLVEIISKRIRSSQDPFFLEKVSETVAWINIDKCVKEEGGITPPKIADSEGVEGNLHVVLCRSLPE